MNHLGTFIAFYRPGLVRFEMRSVLLCFLLVFGLLTPVYGQQPKAITNSIGMKLVLIHAGSFTMGSPAADGRKEETPPHEVTISKSYYLGSYEVTQDQYEKVIGSNPSRFNGSKYPVERVSWDDAVSFCQKLSEMPEEKAAGRRYQLPTEAEWEYACRAGSTTSYSFGDTAESLGEFAWFGENSEQEPHPVGEKKPNRWGLHDMHGNVWEWCQDWHADYTSDEATDPQGPIRGLHRVYRSASWEVDACDCRSATRGCCLPLIRIHEIGFRVAMSLPAKKPATASTK